MLRSLKLSNGFRCRFFSDRVIGEESLYVYIIQKIVEKYLSHHDQHINVPTAGVQAFLIDYPQEKRAITYQAGSVRIGGS
jgi:hypothetical protein